MYTSYIKHINIQQLATILILDRISVVASCLLYAIEEVKLVQ